MLLWQSDQIQRRRYAELQQGSNSPWSSDSLPPAPSFRQRYQAQLFRSCDGGVDLVPEQVLHLVAEEIDELVNADAIKHAPRLKDIQSMCVNVMQMQRALEKFVAIHKASLPRRQRTT